MVVTGFAHWANEWANFLLKPRNFSCARICMNFRTVFAVHRPLTSSTKCILQFWQRFSRTLEKSGRTSFAWLHEFCANRGLTGKMYGRVLKIDFVPVFNTIPRARICMNFQTVFADTQLVVSSTRCIRSWVRCTVLQKENLNYRTSDLKISPVLKNQTILKTPKILNFSCAHAWDQEIWNKSTVCSQVCSFHTEQNLWQPLGTAAQSICR